MRNCGIAPLTNPPEDNPRNRLWSADFSLGSRRCKEELFSDAVRKLKFKINLVLLGFYRSLDANLPGRFHFLASSAKIVDRSRFRKSAKIVI